MLAKSELLQVEAVKHCDEAVCLHKIEVDSGKADMPNVLQSQEKLGSTTAGLIIPRKARRSECVNLHLSRSGDLEAANTMPPPTTLLAAAVMSK